MLVYLSLLSCQFPIRKFLLALRSGGQHHLRTTDPIHRQNYHRVQLLQLDHLCHLKKRSSRAFRIVCVFPVSVFCCLSAFSRLSLTFLNCSIITWRSPPFLDGFVPLLPLEFPVLWHFRGGCFSLRSSQDCFMLSASLPGWPLERWLPLPFFGLVSVIIRFVVYLNSRGTTSYFHNQIVLLEHIDFGDEFSIVMSLTWFFSTLS